MVCGGLWWIAVVCLLVIPPFRIHSHSLMTSSVAVCNWSTGIVVAGGGGHIRLHHNIQSSLYNYLFIQAENWLTAGFPISVIDTYRLSDNDMYLNYIYI